MIGEIVDLIQFSGSSASSLLIVPFCQASLPWIELADEALGSSQAGPFAFVCSADLRVVSD